LGTSMRCEEPSRNSSLPLTRRAEKSESSEPHPESSQRRYDFFDEKLAALAQCQRDENRARLNNSWADFSRILL